MPGPRHAFAAVLLAVLACAAITPALSEQRIALVIGNSAYADSPLSNPVNDAKLISAALRAQGFEVIERLDVGRLDMDRAVMELGNRLKEGGSDAVGLFYYAGHGVQVNDENYLIPIGVPIADESDVNFHAVSADRILRIIEDAGNALNIVILDASRNTPLAHGFLASKRGLARMRAPRGTLIAYAAAPGKVALDGEGASSPYAQALAKAIGEPGLLVEQMFKDLRKAVLNRTSGRQMPWEASSLISVITMARAPQEGGPEDANIPAPPPALAIEQADDNAPRGDLGQLSARLQEARRLSTEAQEQVTRLDEEIAVLRTQVSEQDDETEAAAGAHAATIADLQGQLEAAQASEQELGLDAAEAQEQMARLNEDIAVLRTELSEQRGNTEAAAVAADARETVVADLQQRLAATTAALETAQTDGQSLGLDAAEARRELAEQRRIATEVERQIVRLEEEIGVLQTQLAAQRGKIEVAAVTPEPVGEPQAPAPYPALPAAPDPVETARVLAADVPAEPLTGWRVQLGAYRSPEAAAAGWLSAADRAPALLEPLHHFIARVDLGEPRGVYHRLHVGPLAGRQTADGLCTQLKAAGMDCFVVAP